MVRQESSAKVFFMLECRNYFFRAPATFYFLAPSCLQISGGVLFTSIAEDVFSECQKCMQNILPLSLSVLQFFQISLKAHFRYGALQSWLFPGFFEKMTIFNLKMRAWDRSGFGKKYPDMFFWKLSQLFNEITSLALFARFVPLKGKKIQKWTAIVFF